MSLQNSNYTDSTLSDFSSTLLDVSMESQDNGETIINLSSDDHGSPDNSNLSNVLSQIQDDGPANVETVKQKKISDRASNMDDIVYDVSDNQQGAKIENNAACRKKGLTVLSNKFKLTKVIFNSSYFQPLWILFITVAVVITMYNIDSRTSKLETALSDYDTNLQDNIDTISDELSPAIMKINVMMKSVQESVQLIKSDYLAFDKKYEKTIENTLAVKTEEVITLKNNISLLGSEVLSLKEDLEVVKDKFKPVNKKLHKKVISSKEFTVNLASLSNQDSVNKLVKKLNAAGLLPKVEKTVIKDKRIFRVSVSGFTDLKQAKTFIRNAGKDYGITDSRIRKS